MKQKEAEYGLSLLASTLAHEIRNPLQSIRLQIEIAKRGGMLEQVLDSIGENISRLESVVARVQQLSQRYMIHPERVNLRDLLDSTLGTIQLWLNASGILVTTNIHWEGEAMPEGDRELLEQVLLNLCMNAIQAMPSGGKLQISVSEEIDYALIEVEDTGEGMSEETLKVVGTPFFTTKASGSGLGIAFCKTIASLHGGSLEIESLQGSGTKVSLRILKRLPTQPVSINPHSSSPGSSEGATYV